MMKIVAICGSPKGEESVTVQSVKYVQQKFPQHSFNLIHIGARMKKIEREEGVFEDILRAIASCDALMWCFPVFDCLLPSPLKRFIELIFERKKAVVFAGKYATALTTSVHYFDHTAHNYIQGISEDLGLHAIQGFSAEMGDLLKPEKREDLVAFFGYFFEKVTNRWPVERVFQRVDTAMPVCRLPQASAPEETTDYPILLITDAADGDTNIKAMTDYFVASLGNPVEIINLRELDIKGGCLSCYHCADQNVCTYNDDLIKVFNEKIPGAKGLIFAGTIRDRYLSSIWKSFVDRGFVHGHTPQFNGKYIAWLVSGPLRCLANTRQILEAQSSNNGARLMGIVTDEDAPDEMARQLESLGHQLIWALDHPLPVFESFFTAGSQILFRDMVYGMRFFFQADHRYYKEHGFYDFPQKEYKTRLLNTVMLLLSRNAKFKNEMYASCKEEMLKPYRKVLG